MPTDPQFLTVAEVAAQLRVDPTTVRRWIAAGELPASRLGKNFRIAAADVDAFLDRSRVLAEPTAASP